MKILIQSSKYLNHTTILVLVGLIIFQIFNISTLSSEVDDIGIYHTLVEAQERKIKLYKRVETSSNVEIINEIEKKGNAHAKTLAVILEALHILKPSLKLIADYKSLYSVPMGWTYAPCQYFITQLLISGEESYQTAKFKIRVVSKFFWLLGIIGIILLISKVKHNNTTQAGLLFLVLIICSHSQTSYSAHGSSYAAGLFASSIAMLVTVKLFKSEQLSIPDILLLMVVTVIQYQLIPLVLLIFILSWLRILFFDNLIKKDKAQRISNLIRCSLLFALLFLSLVFPIFKDKLGSGLNWNVGSNKEYSLNDNYRDLFHEVTFQKLINLIIEPLNACINTFASLFSPMHFSSLSVNLVGLPIIALITIAFANLSKYKLIKPYLDASATILILHFFLYVLGVIPFSPTRHSLYLTVPLTVIGVVGINHLIFTYEILYPKLINPIFNLFVLILALACAYLNISYILERKDPFDEVKVLELLTSRETPAIIINSDWTYQHYEIPQVSKVKLLLDLNLSSKRDKFNEQLEKVRPVIGSLNNGDTIKLIRISHWRPLNIDNTQVEIKDIICKHFKYNCLLDTSNELFSSTNKVSSEWVNNIQGFSNSLYIDTLSIYVIGSSSKN